MRIHHLQTRYSRDTFGLAKMIGSMLVKRQTKSLKLRDSDTAARMRISPEELGVFQANLERVTNLTCVTGTNKSTYRFKKEE